MDTNQIVSIVAGVLVIIAILAIVVWPQIRKSLAMSGGVETPAIVKNVRQTSTKDENNRFLHEFTLEVRPANQAPYVVTVKQVVPWMHGSGMAGSEVRVRVHPSNRNWVVIVSPDRRA